MLFLIKNGSEINVINQIFIIVIMQDTQGRLKVTKIVNSIIVKKKLGLPESY